MSGLRPIRLDLGVPGWPPPAEAVEAARAHAADPAAYAPPGGLPELREALAEKVRSRNGISAGAERIVVTTGASMAVVAILAARGSSDRPLLLPDPGYPAFTRVARTLGVPVVHYPAGRADTVDRLEELLDRTAPCVLLWNSPHNPTGAVACPDEVRRLAALVAERGVTLVSDEVYEDFVFEGRHLSPASLIPDADAYTVFSFSKTYAMAGWRGGYLVAPAGGTSDVERVHWALAMNAPLPAQVAALAALRACGGYLAEMRGRADGGRQRAAAALRAEGVEFVHPTGALFLWARVEPRAGGDRFARLAWDCCRVAVQAGAPFGPSGAGHVRLSYGGDAGELDEALLRLVALWRALGGC